MPDYSARVRQKLKDQPTDDGVERIRIREFRDVLAHEGRVRKARAHCASPRSRERAFILVDTDDVSLGSDKARNEQRDVADAAADVKNALAGRYARIEEEPLGVWRQNVGLTNEPAMLDFRGPKHIIRTAHMILAFLGATRRATTP